MFRLKAFLPVAALCMGAMIAGAAQGQAPAPRSIAYGPDRLQQLDFWPARAAANGQRPPLIVFVHGGAWSMGDKDKGTGPWKATHFPEEGYAFASLDYRLVPAARVEDEAGDIALALRALADRAGELGFDRNHIVLMGHSAGAHLVALLSTDPAYLKRAGLSFDSIAGTIAIDGAGYDVPAQMANAGPLLRRAYVQAFGTDEVRQRALSPSLRAAPPTVGHFLLLHVQRPDGIAQAKELAQALQHAGAAVQVNGFAGDGLAGHMTINRRLGDPSYEATPVVDQWLAGLFAH
ncbi:MAG TPA: alpha/beta hydrolase [Novosphingobium sp.]|nr:alpha/beta hydrolase [Novosphingobium sp.]